MSKRFIDTSTLPKSFRKLDLSLKQAWFYLWTKCDKAGVWEVDLDLFEFENGFELDIDKLKKELSDLILFSDEILVLKNFVNINYGELKENYNPHKPVFRSFLKYSLKLEPSLNQACFKLVDEYVKEEEKEKEEEIKEVKPKKFNKSSFRKKLIELDCDEQQVDDWLVVRTAKKGAFTQTALNAIIKDCETNNFLIKDAVRISSERGWSSFKYSWLKNDKDYKSILQSTGGANYESHIPTESDLI